MKEKYKIVILFTEFDYDRYINMIKAEENKENIEVLAVCTGEVKPGWYNMLDGWRMMDLEEALMQPWDYLIYAGAREQFKEITGLLQEGLGISSDRILPIAIFTIPRFDFRGYVRLLESRISIISHQCFGGFTYHYLRMQFRSPFVNMFIPRDEYLALLSNLEEYLQLEVENAGEGWDGNQQRNYPIGKLGDIHLHFNHYGSFEEAVQKWEERKKRINRENLFVQMSADTKERAERFDKLPFKNKALFVPQSFGLKSEINIEALNQNKKEVAAFVNDIAGGVVRYYDPIKLLNGDKDFIVYS